MPGRTAGHIFCGYFKFQFSGQCPLTLRDFRPAIIATPSGPPGSLLLFKFQFIALLGLEICRTSGATAAAGRKRFPRGWCSAQRIKILMIAGGNHSLIHSCQESALRNRFLTEEEFGQKSNCIVDVSGLGSGNAFRGLCRIPHVRLPPAFLFRPRCRSATFPPGEGMRRTAALSAQWVDTFHFPTER